MKNKRHGCTCKKCIECCTRDPGWFFPDEIELAANFLNVTEPEFIRDYCTEHFEHNIYTLSPKKKTNKKECIFLSKDKQCNIHEVKPYECRKVYGCESESRHRRIRDIIKGKWQK